MKFFFHILLHLPTTSSEKSSVLMYVLGPTPSPLCVQCIKKIPFVCLTSFTTPDTNVSFWPVHVPHIAPRPPLTHISELLEEDVAEECQYACRQQPDHTLVDGDNVLQGVDALLHGIGVDVVIN